MPFSSELGLSPTLTNRVVSVLLLSSWGVSEQHLCGLEK